MGHPHRVDADHLERCLGADPVDLVIGPDHQHRGREGQQGVGAEAGRLAAMAALDPDQAAGQQRAEQRQVVFGVEEKDLRPVHEASPFGGTAKGTTERAPGQARSGGTHPAGCKSPRSPLLFTRQPDELSSVNGGGVPMRFWRRSLAATVMAAGLAGAQGAGIRPDQAVFRETYKELVEINTTLSVGDCTAAAKAMSARLSAAGFPDSDLHLIVEPTHPKEGNLVAILPGRDPKAKAILLLAHIDVVEANRADWTRDPFTLIEEDGWFYARGASDDKAQAAIWVDTLIRYKKEGYKPRRTLKMALTCGEESDDELNGADLLVTKHRDLIDAGLALNEGAGGLLDDAGKPVSLSIQSGEKVYQDFHFEVTNPGGHSSRPYKDNAITRLSAALIKVGADDFPVELNATTKAYFAAMAPLVDAENGAAMKALVADPKDAKAVAALSRNVMWNSMMRTTCVPTLSKAGHAPNALPQRAWANVNCRILPGHTAEETRLRLAQVVGDEKVSIVADATSLRTPPPPPLSPAIMEPLKKQAAKIWPGVPIVPFQTTGATDGKYTNAAGIPTYGLTGIFSDASGNGTHGLNERIRVKSLYDARDLLYALVKDYADAK